MAGPLVADTGGLLRAVTRRPDGRPMWPSFARALATASRVVVPAPVLTELDYFLRGNRPAMRQLVAELFNPHTTFEYHPATADDILRAMELDQKFHELEIGLVDGVVAAWPRDYGFTAFSPSIRKIPDPYASATGSRNGWRSSLEGSQVS